MLSDPVDCAIDLTVRALRECFAPDSTDPPIGGGSADVRLFAGEGTPTAAVDVHMSETDCAVTPFLWVRLVRRYRTLADVARPYVGDTSCAAPPAVTLEIGVARCAVVSADGVDWDALAAEAEIGIDDSARIALAQCRAATLMRAEGCSEGVGLDVVTPYGPEGGVIAWLAMLHIRL